MRVEGIKDRESLQAWLEALPQGSDAEREEARRWAVAIAHRAAMRVLPMLWEWSLRDKTLTGSFSPLPVLRCDLISGIAGKGLTPEIIDAGRTAIGAVRASAIGIRAAINAASHASANAVRAVIVVGLDATLEHSLAATTAATAASAEAMYDMIRADCAALEQGAALDRHPLWQDENPLAQLWADTRPKILAQGEGWRFWVDWYDKALTGTPQDWPLLTRIALIDPEDWDKGADHVNALIAQIIAEHTPKSGFTPRPPGATTVAAIKAHVPVNRPVLSLQLAGLLEVSAAEIERLRCDNVIDPEAREALTEALTNLRTAAQMLLDLLPADGPVPDETAVEMGSWAEVLKTEAQHWNCEAKKFLSGKPADQRVDLGGRVLLASMVAGPLALMGLPSFATIAGGAILLQDKFKDIPKVISSSRSSS
ncbi:MAG: hypothetical protein EA407_11605 [Rhodobacteraceae bacterium]|nr:MAG: hypothetical protein EA407_11605 [Paracoccaceae bacterium]